MSTNTTAARATILNAIRVAVRDVPEAETPDDVLVARDYQTSDPSPRAVLIERFIERVAEYKAAVSVVPEKDLPRAIADACASRNIKRLVVPADLPGGWAPAGVTLLREPGLTIEQIESSDGVLTACALGIAQTGTVVLDAGPGQGRRVITLLPDYHLCVIRDDQVVGLVPEAVARLQPAADSGRPITFISGPSATSDIELNRVEGVHGPRTLQVIVVETGR
jgi:L-lactate dehydrogenase complex protein LldG